jgi:uncharacterized protein YjbJ (UPF0337 family)
MPLHLVSHRYVNFSGDRKLKTKGKVDQVEGAIHNAAGDAKDAGKEAIDSVRNAPSKQ